MIRGISISLIAFVICLWIWSAINPFSAVFKTSPNYTGEVIVAGGSIEFDVVDSATRSASYLESDGSFVHNLLWNWRPGIGLYGLSFVGASTAEMHYFVNIPFWIMLIITLVPLLIALLKYRTKRSCQED